GNTVPILCVSATGQNLKHFLKNKFFDYMSLHQSLSFTSVKDAALSGTENANTSSVTRSISVLFFFMFYLLKLKNARPELSMKKTTPLHHTAFQQTIQVNETRACVFTNRKTQTQA
ncbi:MAG: hypothetical protein IJO94_07130, partial [Firmicutes bacterium]|nr:hypothetical protein [Bacillota bacterium]